MAFTATTSGAGVLATTVSPAAIAFGAVVQHTQSAARNVKLTNNLDVPLTGITLVPSRTEYAVSGCPATLAARASCTASVIFSPTAPPVSSRAATLATGTMPLRR